MVIVQIFLFFAVSPIIDWLGLFSLSIQLLRECPPGFGGVERTAHELAVANFAQTSSLIDSEVFCFAPCPHEDPLPVPYRRSRLYYLRLGRFRFPLPWGPLLRFLFIKKPLYAHLPSPEVLVVVILLRLIQRKSQITVYWHAMLSGFYYELYQKFALLFIKWHNIPLLVTSPVLRDSLISCGLNADLISILPCCLSSGSESMAIQLANDRLSCPSPIFSSKSTPFRVICIGRLDTYKRVDWVIEAISLCSNSFHLTVIGDGPNKAKLESHAFKLLYPHTPYYFKGKVSEYDKFLSLSNSDLLILASNSSHEAFGIVQLEAMACGVPALALNCSNSGATWVSSLSSLPSWEVPGPDSLAKILSLISSTNFNYLLLSRESFSRYHAYFSRDQWHLSLYSILNIRTHSPSAPI